MLKEATFAESPKSGDGAGATTKMLVDVAVFCGEAESVTVRVAENEPDVAYMWVGTCPVPTELSPNVHE